MIKTSNEKDAGTDDSIYFGIETKDGVKEKWTLDNPGDDFTKGQEGTYILKLKNNNIKYKDIKNIWIRKEKFTTIRDDWKPEYIKVISNGKVQCEKSINIWLSGDVTYEVK